MIMLDAGEQGEMKSDPLYRGAHQGSQSAFGAGTGLHDPCTVATEVYEDTLAIRSTIKNLFAYGRTLGFRRATSYLRRAMVEKRYRQREIERLSDSVICGELNNAEEREQREKFLFHILTLSEVDAYYVFLRNYCDLGFRAIKTVVETLTGEAVSINTHQYRYELALARFKRAIAERERH